MEILIRNRLTCFPADMRERLFCKTLDDNQGLPANREHKPPVNLEDITLMESYMLSELELVQYVAAASSNTDIFWKELQAFIENEKTYCTMTEYLEIFRFFRKGTSVFGCYHSRYRKSDETNAILEFRENRDFPLEDCAAWVCRNCFPGLYDPVAAEIIQEAIADKDLTHMLKELKDAIYHELGLPEIENVIRERFRYNGGNSRTLLSVAVFRHLYDAW
jgi:hypothetical protein